MLTMRGLLSCIAALAALAVPSGCGHPSTPGTGSGIAPVTCGPGDATCAALVIDQPAEVRKALALAEIGGVVVAADGHSIRVLPDCTFDASYGFVRLLADTHSLQLSDEQSVGVNLPTLAGTSGAKVSAEYQHGATLDVAWEIVGSRRTTATHVTRDGLQGTSCKEATHYVRAVDVGQFSIKRGTRGALRAAAEMFGAGASGATESSASIESSAGTAAACKQYDDGDDGGPPPTDCSVPVRIALEAIVDGNSQGAVDQPAPPIQMAACPAGYRNSGALCTKGGQAGPYRCDPGDAADCDAQCQRGNADSCAIAGALHSKGGDDKAALELFVKGCNGQSAEACFNLGALAYNAAHDVDSALKALKPACQLGYAPGCQQLAKLYSGKPAGPDLAAVASFAFRACNAGDAASCFVIGDMLTTGAGMPADPARGAIMAKRGCDGGIAEGCQAYGFAVQSGVMEKNMFNAAKAYTKACNGGVKMACVRLATVVEFGSLPKPGQTPVPKSDEMAHQLYTLAYDASVDASTYAGAILNVVYKENHKIDAKMAHEQMATLMKECKEQHVGSSCGFRGILAAALGMHSDAEVMFSVGCAYYDDEWSCVEGNRLHLLVAKK